MPVVVRLIIGVLIACSLGTPALAKGGRASPAKLQERVRAWLEPRVGDKRHDGQYMRQDCHDADLTQLPDWKGLPVQTCTYTDTQFPGDNVTTTAYLLFPTAQQLASWVVNACIDAGRKDLTL